HGGGQFHQAGNESFHIVSPFWFSTESAVCRRISLILALKYNRFPGQINPGKSWQKKKRPPKESAQAGEWNERCHRADLPSAGSMVSHFLPAVKGVTGRKPLICLHFLLLSNPVCDFCIKDVTFME
ncbi:MAG: hypothetical protein IJE03_03770, partial [Ruminiclostridium sp.]|nr:hypothetical protein [Ruminiclostridium sp.]